jgi:hypothetical protein
MIVTIDCPKCEKWDSFEMVHWSDRKSYAEGWDINLQKCDCEITPEMESELEELANDEAADLSYDPSMED